MWLFVLTLTLSTARAETVEIGPYTKCVSGLIGVIAGKALKDLGDEKLIGINDEMRKRYRTFRFYRGTAEECDYSGMDPNKVTYDALNVPMGGQPKCHPPASMKAARRALHDLVIGNLKILAAAATQNGIRPNRTAVGAVVNQCADLGDGGDEELNGALATVRENFEIPMQRSVDRGTNAAG